MCRREGTSSTSVPQGDRDCQFKMGAGAVRPLHVPIFAPSLAPERPQLRDHQFRPRRTGGTHLGSQQEGPRASAPADLSPSSIAAPSDADGQAAGRQGPCGSQARCWVGGAARSSGGRSRQASWSLVRIVGLVCVRRYGHGPRWWHGRWMTRGRGRRRWRQGHGRRWRRGRTGCRGWWWGQRFRRWRGRPLRLQLGHLALTLHTDLPFCTVVARVLASARLRWFFSPLERRGEDVHRWRRGAHAAATVPIALAMTGGMGAPWPTAAGAGHLATTGSAMAAMQALLLQAAGMDQAIVAGAVMGHQPLRVALDAENRPRRRRGRSRRCRR